MSDGICTLGKNAGENVEHICGDNYKVWKMIQSFIDEICDDVLIDRNVILSGVLKRDDIHDIVNMVLSITRWIIWKRRCITKYENEYIDVIQLQIWICKELIEHCQVIRNPKYAEIMKTLICKIKIYMSSG